MGQWAVKELPTPRESQVTDSALNFAAFPEEGAVAGALRHSEYAVPARVSCPFLGRPHHREPCPPPRLAGLLSIYQINSANVA